MHALPFATPLALVLFAPLFAAQNDGTIVTSPEGSLEPVVRAYDRPGTLRANSTEPFGDTGIAADSDFLSVNQNPEGDMPREVAFSADGTEAVIVNRDTDTVTFFDVATATITDTVDVGDFPVSVAVTPNNQLAVVANPLSDNVSLIDMASHTVVATVAVTGTQPYRVEVTTDSAFAVVGVINDGINSSISVIDLVSFTEVRSFPTTPQGTIGFFWTGEPGIVGNIFTEFALSPDNVTLVLPDRFNDQVAIYDVTTGNQLGLLATDDEPTAVDISSDGTMAVVSLDGAGASVVTIDLSVPVVTGSFVTGSSTFMPLIRITPDKSHAMLGVLNSLEFVNLTTGAVTTTISTGSVGDIQISFDGKFAIVSNYNLRVIRIGTQKLVKTITFASCYDGAASPVEHRVVTLNNRFREDVQLYNTDGGSGFFEGFALSGEVEEADAPRTLALTPDGRTALVVNNTSYNATTVDLETQTVSAYIPTGARSLGVAVSSDGVTGVVANAASDSLSILDLDAGIEVANLAVPSVPTEVAISPDGLTAYVTSVSGADRVYFVDLAGAASAVSGSLFTGQMGSIGYTYSVFSGISVSPDGATLALCISFDNELMLVDTATRTEIARVPVGDFPIRATFSPDSSQVYVTHSFSDDLYQVSVNGGASAVTGVTGNIKFPLHVTLNETGKFAYVGSFDFNNPSLVVVKTATMNKVATLALSSGPRSHARVGDALFVSLSGGDLLRLQMAGGSTAIVESVALAGSPSDMVFSPALGLAVTTQPGALDGLDLVHFGGDATRYCDPAVPNSTGQSGALSVSGTFLAGGFPLHLQADFLPVNQFGYFLAGQTQGLIVSPPGSQGNLCLSGAIARFVAQIQNSGASGSFGIDVDTLQIPFAPPVAILAGETWNFTAWHRDLNPGPTSNFTDAVSVLFE
jgi:YVTN family beta-propeller protein